VINGYTEKFIKDLTPKDIKVAVSGIVIESGERKIVIDDGSGWIGVEMENEASQGDFVRVFGFLMWNGERVEMKGNVMQDISGTNREIYDSVKKLMNK
jgi:hypothetical protein